MHRLLPLSSLVAGRSNPRRVRPDRAAHRRLVSSIRAYGLLEPLVVRPCPQPGKEGDASTEVPSGGGGRFEVVAGRRRLDALRVVHRGADPASVLVPCTVHDVAAEVARGMALSENFAREGMHPLDEAEAFARLAHHDAKGVSAIAAEFGVTKRYVRQRMQLAGLADVVKAAYRDGQIDTATAEVFAGVPAARQAEVWASVDGQVRDARHAERLVAADWIDATHARFDIDDLPPGAVCRDLFGDRVRVERRAFMDAQAEALVAEQARLLDDGWAEVVVAPREQVQDRLYAMSAAPVRFDSDTQARLEAVHTQRETLEAQLDALGDADGTEAETQEQEAERLYDALDRLDEQAERIEREAEPCHDEAVKAVGCVFLVVGSDGGVETHFRVPRVVGRAAASGSGPAGRGRTGQAATLPEVTPDQLSDRQVTAALAHEVVAVRSALTQRDATSGARADRTRRVLLAMLLHDAVRGEALCVRREPDPLVRFFAPEVADADAPPHPSRLFMPWAAQQAHRAALDPLALEERCGCDEAEAYRRINALDDRRLDALIETLIVASVTVAPGSPGGAPRRGALVAQLVADLEVDVRASWTPDADWFKGYRKLQLAQLLDELRGSGRGFRGAAERRKKSELVEELATLFQTANAGRLADHDLAARVNAWTPACLRDADATAGEQTVDAESPEASVAMAA